jgi:hypothetical protein
MKYSLSLTRKNILIWPNRAKKKRTNALLFKIIGY